MYFILIDVMECLACVIGLVFCLWGGVAFDLCVLGVVVSRVACRVSRSVARVAFRFA